ncbi:hypothetical protein BDZ94DRAFT_1255620 [Collybia nuda]|uniref:Uncharacterized protein n=1 Tax=Collybia nuda TaxID=64659 RepID=A0A9P5YBI8_9AGAR|nr:hypothetical protein BDZ94DRAFT_1255620 [Collybia nuda]
MKVYHLAKAKDPTDLPSWLFDEGVRRRSIPTFANDNNKDIYQTRQESSNHLPKLRGLRDVYDAAASTPSIPTSRSIQGRNRIHDIGEPSKAANRLKLIREAKRSALTANAAPRLLSDNMDEYQPVARDHDDKRKIDRRVPRLGLPPGPRRM